MSAPPSAAFGARAIAQSLPRPGWGEVSVTIPGGATAGLSNPWILLALPVALIALWWAVFRSDGTASRRSRHLLFVSRVLVIAMLVLAAAGPYTVQTKETTGDPHVTLLTDRSDSMAVVPPVGDDLAADIERAGVPVTTTTIAEGTTSRVGDAVAANLQENGSVVVVSDGRVTAGQSVADAAELADDLNATISTVETEPRRTERYVALNGPSKASVGVESTFLARVQGVLADEGETTLTVTVDGEEALSRELENGSGAVEFGHTFEEVGSHRVTATVESSDQFEENDVFRKTVRVVERPRILYVSRGSYPFEEYLSELYNVQTAEFVPENLSDDYYAVVIQDVAAADLGNVDALQEFVIDGNGLLVVGGDSSFENGGYEDSPIASMLPVTMGEASGGSTNIVMAIDVSGSAQEGMRVQKAIALDALDQLGDENSVGIVGFNWRAYRVAQMNSLSENRDELSDRIRRLQSGGATSLSAGLRGSAEMLGDEQGTILFISDGRADLGESGAIARDLRSDGVRVITIGAGSNPKESTLRAIAESSGGSYFRASETDRLRLLFGGASRRYEGEGLTIVDPNSFITSGVTLESNPPAANDVSERRGADLLVASGEGKPAVTSWRYGLGRVVSVTAYGDDGTLDGLLRRPDSLLLTKSTNYVIGDPERKATGVTEIPDTRVGESTTVTYRGDDRPNATDAGVQFSKVDDRTYRATVTPTERGYGTVLNASYAANYPVEYGAFGPSAQLRSAVEATGGRTFERGQGAEIAEFAREQSTRVRSVEEDWSWLFLALGFVGYLAEVFTRRIQVYRGRTTNEGGLS